MIAPLLPEAQAEMSEAAVRYEGDRAGLGGENLVAVNEAVESIVAMPLLFGFYEALPDNHRFRRLRMRRFPYVVIYECREDHILIVAVAHTSRRPGYWLRRTEGE